MVPEDLFTTLEDWCGAYLHNTIDLYSRKEKEEWVIIEFAEFLNWVTPETIEQMMEDKQC